MSCREIWTQRACLQVFEKLFAQFEETGEQQRRVLPEEIAELAVGKHLFAFKASFTEEAGGEHTDVTEKGHG